VAQDPVPGWTRSKEHAPRVLGVAELNRIARFSLEDRFPDVWVEGELADVSRPASGHVYFTLCDVENAAQVKGVMYRGDAQRSRAKLENGVRVRMRCALTLFEPRGVFQIAARVALPAGEGDRAAEIARVRQRLAADGLLDPSRKRALPRFPRVVGVVTSRDGAAIHDVVTVARGRLGVRMILAHCQVQGPDAPLSIVRALNGIQRVPDLDLVIVARGGGASEDLGAFDDERVARAVAACRVPTVSGVGHEVDVTLVDLVADVRAATPSNAAEIAVPDGEAVRGELEALERALARALDQRIQRHRLVLERVMRRMPDPRRGVAAPRQELASLHAALERSTSRRLGEAHKLLDRLRARLAVHEPRSRLARDRERLGVMSGALARAMRTRIAELRRAIEDEGEEVAARGRELGRERRGSLEALAGKLGALSPLGILARGYAIALHDGRAVVKASEVRAGDRIDVRVHEGTIEAVVRSGDEG
jgi:exodeoxyribonuclease VII large subunit